MRIIWRKRLSSTATRISQSLSSCGIGGVKPPIAAGVLPPLELSLPS
jgi:hypothetical protein